MHKLGCGCTVVRPRRRASRIAVCATRRARARDFAQGMGYTGREGGRERREVRANQGERKEEVCERGEALFGRVRLNVTRVSESTAHRRRVDFPQRAELGVPIALIRHFCMGEN